LSEVDDRVERYFLELKSDVDLSKSPGQAKVAKFILGAANRARDVAARRFEAHALFVLGVAKGSTEGIPSSRPKTSNGQSRSSLVPTGRNGTSSGSG
jgi:hypothetical protein